MARETIIENHVYGGQVITATDNSTVYTTQKNNDTSIKQIDSIMNDIIESLSELKKEDAEEDIRDVVDMVKEELVKSKPKAGRLRNCITVISYFVTVLNGVPNLVKNLQKLAECIKVHIK